MKIERATTHGLLGPAENRLEKKILFQLQESLAPASPGESLWIGFLALVMLAGGAAYIYQLTYGLKVTAMREYVSWGVYMTNFVFFIGVSHAGTLISAILRVTGAEWRRSITRMAEAITVFSLAVGAPMVIIDMGRPDRILNVLIYGRMNSPILWDVCSIATYMCGSLLYLYVAMIPDLALLAPSKPHWERVPWLQRLYRFLSLGYRGTPEQKRLLERALATMAVIIIPVAISVHTVVSWIFGMTLRPGWHSTIFGPYFVIGAIFSGTAAIITAMAIFRKVYHLENYLTERQFQNLGRLLLALNLLYVYFTLAEYLTAWYGAETPDKRLIDLLMGNSTYGAFFWCWATFCLFLPALIMLAPMKKNLIARLVVASLLINIGMWLKRYLIIVPTLMTTFIPAEAADVTPRYLPTWVEWTVTAGGLATFLMLFTLFAKFFPIVSIWETVEGVEELGAENIGVDPALELTEEPRPAHHRRPAHPARLSPALRIIPILLLAGACSALAAETESAKPQPRMTLTSAVEKDHQLLRAAVRLNDKPVPDAQVEFFVERTFGKLSLGTNATQPDGMVSVQLPTALSGGTNGELKIIAEIKAPPEYASVSAQVVVTGRSTQPDEGAFPHALWAPRAPYALVITIFTLLSIVWTTYFFVITQLIKIRKAADE